MTRRPRSAPAFALLALIGLLATGFVLPPDKIVGVLHETRKKAEPLRVEFDVRRSDASDERVTAELHPDRGVRVTADSGERWLLRDARVVASPGASTDWIPELDVVLLRGENAIASWLEAKGVSQESSHLARCGESDCFVIGQRGFAHQLWIDKESFEVRRFVGSGDRVVELDNWADLGGARFATVTRISYGGEVIAEWTAVSARVDPSIDRADFSANWVRAN